MERMEVEDGGGAEVSLPPLQADLVIESVETEPKESQPGAEEERDGEEKNHEFLGVRVQLSAEAKEAITGSPPRTHLIIVVDTSGSMYGEAWRQAQQGLLEIVENSIRHPHITTDVVHYNVHAHRVEFNAENYRTQIGLLEPNGQTSFRSAFNKTLEIIRERRERESFQRLVIIFMTDGGETMESRDRISEALEGWHRDLRDTQGEVVVHTLGFSRSHDYGFLSKLVLDGMFRYCESSDGPDALQAKMGELYRYILGAMLKLQVVISADEGCQFLTGKGAQASVELVGELKEDASGGLPVVVADSWMKTSSREVPKFRVEIQGEIQEDGASRIVKIPCEVKVSRKILEGTAERARWAMRIVDRFATILAESLTKAVEEKTDVTKLRGRMERLQKQLSNIPIYNPAINKDERSQLLIIHDDIQSKMDILHSMIAGYARGETASVSMLARMHDLRYDAQFSKARRQRLMDRRAATNISRVQKDQELLDQYQPDLVELEGLSPEALDFFFCALAQSSVKDILLDTSDKENSMGFGLAVRRLEHVTDEPTMIVLQVISGTLVCRTSLLDAIEHKISVDGQLRKSSGFDFTGSLGVATVGTSREPINAWLPLFISQTHWARVKLLLKPTLGYFCCLDPLGYNSKQMSIMFMVLGQMIGRLSLESVGEHQLRLLFAVQRTCSAIVRDFYLEAPLEKMVAEFCESPAGRTKDVIPNLYTLIGYLASLPTTSTRKILGYESGDRSPSRKFWTAFLVECLRRASGDVYREKNIKEIYGFLNLLINGTESEGTGSGRAQEVPGCSAMASLGRVVVQEGADPMEPPVFDPIGDAQVPELPLSHSSKMDKFMERWAQAEYGDHVSKNQSKLKEAKKEIKKWLEDIIKHLGICPSDMPGYSVEEQAAETAEEEPMEDTTLNYDVNALTPTTMRVMAKMIYVLMAQCRPTPQAIPACIAFLEWWVANGMNIAELDANSGLAPSAWVERVKEVITNMHRDMTEFEARCRDADPNRLVVMVSEEEVRAAADSAVEVSSAEMETEQTAPSGKGAAAAPTDDGAQPEDDGDDDSDDFLDDSDDGIDFFQADFPASQAYQLPQSDASSASNFSSLLHTLELLWPDEGMAEGSSSGTRDERLVALLRATLCQALLYRTNALARTAISDKKLLDLATGENASATLQELHKDLLRRKTGAGKVKASRNFWNLMNHRLLHAENMWTFIGYLNHAYTDRGEGYGLLFTELLNVKEPKKIPLLAEKIRCLLTAKYNEQPVFAKGNIFFPEQNMVKKIIKVIGDEEWTKIQLELRKGVKIHVYRESDIPNRHGYSNSNPFIPNDIRGQLNMPLLPPNDNTRRSERGLRNRRTR